MKQIFFAAMALFFSTSTLAATPWQQVKQPVEGTPQSIGGFSNGCIIGAQPLSLQGQGYLVMRSQQLRYFGHPDLLAFIHRLTNKTQSYGLGNVLIGDMGMPAGGRFATGHASHQSGLDVDIWLQLPRERWSATQLKNPKAIDLVAGNGKQVVESLWQPQVGELIKLAASDNDVTRIFVHPAIKQKLCQTAGSDRTWLRKVRPWFGHRAHMHVRLRCPADSLECEEQAAIPAGDGCGAELASWLEAPAKLPNAKPKPPQIPEPPASCKALLVNNFKVE
ncbi:penicillin-insensitive murein endopeptidase [Pragia fontium]|uniref:Penicillin-insensitive murein endopeptidase n=1 Tax=Pragia fontium DSM 5563 = ATCC 49100 TaxID=1122977 RepID=A0AAJ4W8T6_9GAMM|nr:penicillin-insensitive murein endopeptidase [Pragia fontium]AKJ41673.1 murein endopeptidase [Pragia fontium]SFC33037.1 penicillin-insensitive murein endopeptidase [Pragia fontium DSM 5563 = ATCC 49100]VEJ54474.1 Penicillin-insensitive murein endopeptidase precursor [Pragia fontium]